MACMCATETGKSLEIVLLGLKRGAPGDQRRHGIRLFLMRDLNKVPGLE